MATEIERKFRVVGDAWRARATLAGHYRQGYLARQAEHATVRVRLTDHSAWLTVKGPTQGISRSEYEYEIPKEDAAAMLETLCPTAIITKARYLLTVGAHRWEIDVFEGANQGLVVAEIELDRSEEPFERPAWLGEEVSDDARYFNAALSTHPYDAWTRP